MKVPLLVSLLNQTLVFTDERTVSSDEVVYPDSWSRNSWEWTSLWVSMVNSGPFLLHSGVKFHTPLMCNILSWVVTVPEALPGDARLEPISEQEWSRNQFSSVQFSCSVLSDSLRSHESQHTRPPCPSPTPGVHSNLHPLSCDAIQPSHPLSSPSPPAPNPSQHQSLFHWVNSSHEVAKVLEFQL